jgi:hypothetical protein
VRIAAAGRRQNLGSLSREKTRDWRSGGNNERAQGVDDDKHWDLTKKLEKKKLLEGHLKKFFFCPTQRRAKNRREGRGNSKRRTGKKTPERESASLRKKNRQEARKRYSCGRSRDP